MGDGLKGRSNGFDVGLSVARVPPQVAVDRLAQSDAAVQARLASAVPPVEMRQAPVAPARGTMALVPDYVVVPGGMRRRVGAHWRATGPLAVMVEQARQRHLSKGGDEDDFVAPFSPGQIAVSEDYRALVERHEAGLVKGSSLEAGRSGSGAGGLAIDSFIQDGRWLDELRRRIGGGMAMQVRRHLDRDNARRAVPVLRLVDMVLVEGQALSDVLARYGWVANGVNRRALRAALCVALDRMQGYRDG